MQIFEAMATIDDILQPQRGGQAEARAGITPQQATPVTAPQTEIKGRSRLNPNGDVNAATNGGEQSLNAATAAPAVQPANSNATATEAQPAPPKTYTEMYDELKKKSEEEEAEEKKKHKRRQLIAAIGDGVSALSNLYFTSQYAPNMYDSNNSMSKSVQVNYDKLRTERDKKNAEHFNNMIKMRQLDDEVAQADRAWKRQLGIDKDNKEFRDKEFEWQKQRATAQDQRADNEEARKAATTQLELQLLQGKINQQQYLNKKAEIEAKYAEQMQQSEIERNRNSGSGVRRKAEFMAYDEYGEENYFETPEAAEYFARQKGTWVEDDFEDTETTTSSTTNGSGRTREVKTTSKTTNKKVNGRSVKPEKKKKANPMS